MEYYLKQTAAHSVAIFKSIDLTVYANAAKPIITQRFVKAPFNGLFSWFCPSNCTDVWIASSPDISLASCSAFDRLSNSDFTVWKNYVPINIMKEKEIETLGIGNRNSWNWGIRILGIGNRNSYGDRYNKLKFNSNIIQTYIVIMNMILVNDGK